MTTIGYATLQVIPSMQGVSSRITQDLTGPMRSAGQAAGRDMGEGVASGVSAARSSVEKASAAVAKARNKEEDAAGKVRVAEAKLQELRDRGITSGSQFVAAEERRNTALRNSRAATDAARAAADDLAEANRRAATASDDAGTSMDDMGRKSLVTGENIAKFGAAAGAALGGVGVALFQIGSTFDDVSDTIRIGTGATGDNLAGLEQIAKNIGSTVPASFEDIGATVADLNTRLGLTGQPLELLSKQVLETGNLFGEALNIDSLTAGFNAFAVKGSDTSKVLDELFQVSQATGVGMNQLTESAVKGAPALKQFGFSMSSSAGLIGSLDKAGLDADKMMGALTKSLAGFAKEGKKPQEALFGVVMEMEKFIAAGDDAKAIELGASIFGTKGAGQFVDAVKLGTLSVDDFVSATGATGDTILGAAADTKDFAEQWMIFKNKVLIALEPIATRVFTAISQAMGWIADNGIPAVRELGQMMGEAGSKISSLTGFVMDNRVAFIAVGAVITTVLLPYLSILAIGYTAAGLAAIASAGQQAIAWATSSAGAVKAAVLTVAQSWRIVGAWMMMGVRATASAAVVAAGWVATGARAAAGALANVGAAAKVVGAWVLMGARATANAVVIGAAWLASSAGAALATTRTLAYVVATNAVRAASVAWTGVQWLLNAALSANPIGLIVVGIGALIAAVVLIATKTTWFQTIWDYVWGAIKTGFGVWWSAVQVYFNAVKAAFQFVGDAALWLWNSAILPAFNGIQAAIALWWTGVQTYFDLVKGAFAAVGNAATAVKDTIVSGFDSVVSFFTGLPERIKTAVAGLFDPIKDTFKSAINWVIQKWNDFSLGFEFKIPVVNKEIKFDVNTPNLPLLAGGGRAGVDSNGKLFGPGTGTSDSILGIDRLTKMPTAFVSNREGVVKADAMDAGGDVVVAALNSGWVPSADYLRNMLPGFADGGQVLNGSEMTTQIQRDMWDAVRTQFPDATLNSGTRYADVGSGYDYHMQGMALDLGGPMDAIANWIYQMNATQPVTELIHAPLNGWQNLKDGAPLNYGPGTDADHYDHVHWAMKSFNNAANIDLGPVPSTIDATPTEPAGPQTPPSPGDPTAAPAASTTAEPEQTFSGRDRFKKMFTDLGGIAADSLIEIVGVGDWLDLADRYTIKASDTAASTPQTTPAAPDTTADASPAPVVTGPPEPPPAPAAPAMPTDVPEGGIAAGSPGAKEAFWNEWANYPGWQDQSQWFDTLRLFNGESGWNALAQNPISTAFGVGQFLDDTWATVGESKSDDPVVQARATGKYLNQRPDYGNPSKAWELWQSRDPHWYDEGGWLPEGLNLTMNKTGGPEPILERSQWDTAEAAINTVKDLALVGANTSGGGDTTVIHATFRDERAFYEERRREARLGMKRYGSGRRRR